MLDGTHAHCVWSSRRGGGRDSGPVRRCHVNATWSVLLGGGRQVYEVCSMAGSTSVGASSDHRRACALRSFSSAELRSRLDDFTPRRCPVFIRSQALDQRREAPPPPRLSHCCGSTSPRAATPEGRRPRALIEAQRSSLRCERATGHTYSAYLPHSEAGATLPAARLSS